MEIISQDIRATQELFGQTLYLKKALIEFIEEFKQIDFNN